MQHQKAIVVGGSNGIGLSLCLELIAKGVDPVIADRVRPEEQLLSADAYQYVPVDLRNDPEPALEPWVKDPSVSTLIITAGYGRVADFDAHHGVEIRDMITVNAISAIRILRQFYPRIAGSDPFFVGVMGSIAGWVSSPEASVYAASKAALVRLIESVNIELEAAGTGNRILDVSPTSFTGSRFYGGKNDPDQLAPMAQEMLKRMEAHETVYYPHQQIVEDVIRRYRADSHAFGMQSLHYKQESGRMDNRRRTVIGYLSGTFDLFHIGHLNLIRRAKEQCDYLIVGVHDSGKWKGKETVISLEERKAIVGACRYVDQVVDACLEDSEAWELYHFDKLFVGSDYQGSQRFQRYEAYFKPKNVKIVYFPYTQSISSTQIRQKLAERKNS